jgi:hypothetical protein
VDGGGQQLEALRQPRTRPAEQPDTIEDRNAPVSNAGQVTHRRVFSQQIEIGARTLRREAAAC